MSQPDNPRPRQSPRRARADYEQGLPGYHDPTAGFGGSAPARSALTLRAVLAGFGALVATLGAIIMFAVDVVAFGILLVVIAVLALVNLGWILHRKRRGEPG